MMSSLYLTLSISVFSLSSLSFAQTSEITKLTASDADGGDQYGHAVAVSNDTLVIGAPLDEASGFFSGSAYVQVRDGATWVEQAKLLGSAITTSDRFGWAVDISGNTLVVSALFGDGANVVSGTAYIFQCNGSTWSETQIIAPADGATSDWFGRSVSLEGNTLAVGAPQDDDAGAESGSVYIFTYNGSAWTQQAKLTASDGSSGDNFGQSVALSGDSVIVGAPFNDDAGSSSGSAYVFTRSGTVWTEQAKLTASDSSPSDSFGYGVAIDQDVALVGAYRVNLGGFGGDAGAAYTFRRNANAWIETQKLTPAGLAAGDDCGWSVAIQGNHLLLSARGHLANQGSAFHFRYNGTSWLETAELIASDGAAGDEFSLGIGLDQERAIIGAYLHDGAGGNAGASYLFDLFRLDLLPSTPIAGQPVDLLLTGGHPNTMSWMAYSLVGPGSTPIPPLGVTLQMSSPIQVGNAILSASDGSASWTVPVPPSVSGVTIWLQALQATHITNLRRVTVL
jgi:hypothetical protein